jgi:AraC-like DNA-binding protein
VSLEVETEPLGFLLCGRLRAGRILFSSRDEEVLVRPGGAALLPVTEGLRTRSEQMDFPFLRLPLERVARVAAERSALGERRLRFHSMRPLSDHASRSFGRVLHLVHAELGAPGPDTLPALLVDHLTDLAAASALTTFPSTATTADHEPGVGRVGLATVRRATASIDERAADPISTADVAAAAGVGVRALQQGFARHTGTTPTGWLRRVRLDRAHAELSAADPASGLTVAAVAARRGFAHPGRFARTYAEAFGESPGDTLRG